MDSNPAASPSKDGFSAKSFSVRAQKKILGKMSSRGVAKHFISDRTGRILDDLYRLLKAHYSKKESEKVVKNVVKVSIKLAVLSRNEQFSEDESAQLAQYERKLRTLLMTAVSFWQVDFSYDGAFLRSLLADNERLLRGLTQRHLSDKSAQRIDYVFAHVAAAPFLDAVFKRDGAHAAVMQRLVMHVCAMLEEREI